MRTRTPFVKSEYCAVVGRSVVLSGDVVALPGTSCRETVGKRCSNVGACISAHGAIDAIPACLLHALKGPG